MPNPIKYSTSAQTLALKRGNFWIGTGDSDKGPSVSSGYYAGITPPEGGGYTIYLSNPGGNYNMFCPTNDTQLLAFTASELGQTFATGPSALNWYISQPTRMVTNIDYPPIVTSSLLLNVDAGFTPSYPRGGTGWYDLTTSNSVGRLINGPSYDSANGGSVLFDGTDDYASFGNILNPSLLNNNFTIEVWFNFNQYLVTGQQRLVSYHDSYTFMIEGVNLKIEILTNAYKSAAIARPPINTWNQLVAIYNGSQLKIYRNGVLSATNGATGSIATTNYIFNLSAFQNLTDYRVSGKMSSVKVYNTELTQTQITQNYQAMFPRFLGQNIVMSGLIEYLNAGYNVSYSGSGTTWTNVAGVSGGNGTLTNGPTYATGNGGAIVFDGTDDYVTIPTFSIPVGSFSCEAFFQWSNLGTSRGSIFSLNYDYPNSGYLIRQKDDGSGKFVVWSDYGSESGIFSNAALLVNTWNHVIVVQNSGICRIYINGILDSSQSLPNPVLSQNFPILLGVRATSGPSAGAYFPGRISFSKIYNRTLSGSEVLQNYQTSLPQILAENIVTSGMVAYWDAGYATSYPGTGTSWFDVSGAAGGTGALTNGPTYATGNGGAIVFDGSDDRVLYGSASGTNYSNVHTFTTWVNINSTGGLGPVVIGHQGFNDGGYAIAFDYGPNRIYYSPSDGAFASATYTFSTNTWFNVTVVRNVRSLTWFINGSQIGTGTTSIANLLCSSIGDYRNGGYPFNGRISLMRIYNRPLTQLEITQNYNAQKSRFGL